MSSLLNITVNDVIDCSNFSLVYSFSDGPVICYILYYQVQDVLVTLWDTLVELDDLTASTNSIMMLLARILSCPSVASQGTEDGDSSLTELVPRLWPFFRHNIKSVRLAALETLQTLLVERLKHKVCTILTRYI